jgi:hypothetical protein
MRHSPLGAHVWDVKESVERAHGELTAFLAKAKEPALLKLARSRFRSSAGAYEIEVSGDRLFVQAWTRDRTLARRVTGVNARTNIRFNSPPSVRQA